MLLDQNLSENTVKMFMKAAVIYRLYGLKVHFQNGPFTCLYVGRRPQLLTTQTSSWNCLSVLTMWQMASLRVTDRRQQGEATISFVPLPQNPSFFKYSVVTPWVVHRLHSSIQCGKGMNKGDDTRK